MEFRDDAHKLLWAKDIAAMVAVGMLDPAICKEKNIIQDDLDAIYALPEFGEELNAVSETAFEEWRERKGQQVVGFQLQDQILENAASYFEIVNDVALGLKTIPDIQSKILMKLLDVIEALNPSGRAKAFHMTPDTLKRYVEAQSEVEEQKPDVSQYEQERRAIRERDSAKDANPRKR